VYALEASLEEKNVSLELTQSARNWLAKQGYDPLMGARPMSRLVQEKIKQPLAERLLFGDLQKGGKVMIDIEDKELVLKTTTNQS